MLLGEQEIARAVLHSRFHRVADVIVYRPDLRRRGIAAALYAYIEWEHGRALEPSKIRTAAGKAFWKAKTGLVT